MLFLLCFSIGFVSGLRSLTAPALVCWAAHLGWLNLAGTPLGFMRHPAAVAIFTLLALVEIVMDKLPNTPSRTAPIGLVARIVLGGLSGGALGLAGGTNLIVGAIVGIIGALVGTYGGYHARQAVVSRMHLPDFVVALAEDAVAIVGGLLVVSHV
jgi:uncharacterized membrane protein